MKQRIICLLLCLVTVLSLGLTSCSEKDDDQTKTEIEEDASKDAKTLTMWLVSEQEVSASTAAAITRAVNAITKAKFKANMVLYFYTEDEYRLKVEEAISAYKKEHATDETTVTTEPDSDAEPEEITEEETVTDERGMSVIVYPELLANQVDIVYINSEDMYLDFIGNGWLSDLSGQLTEGAKKLKEYVSPTLLSAAQQNGKLYAIPNNRAIGEYTYMLLNKELINKRSWDGHVTRGEFDGFFNENVFSYLSQIHKNEPDVTPIAASYDECLQMLAHYWSIDPTDYELLKEFSVFGYHYLEEDELSRGSILLGYDSLFDNSAFVEEYLRLNRMRFEGYFDENTTGKAALRFVSGDSTVLKDYTDEYYAVAIKNPTASSEDIYGNMFGVASTTRDLERSMQIITYLNTNSELRNLMQYGVEGTHYTAKRDETGNVILSRLNNDYMMNIYATGNVFIAYPEPEMSPDIWEIGKEQNRGSLVDPLLGFDLDAFAAATAPAPAAPKLDKVGYNISYTTGYSKETLEQNAELKAWLKKCDESTDGKGVFIFATSTADNLYVTTNYFIYNNNVTADTAFKLDVKRETKTELDDKGKETTVQTHLDFLFKYTETGEKVTDGYNLSIVSLYTRKKNEFEIKCSVNSTDVSFTETKQDTIVTPDFYNSKHYSIEAYEKLTRPAFAKNEMLAEWLQNSTKSEIYLMTYTEEREDCNVITLVVYRSELKYVTDTKMYITGDLKNPTINFDFTYEESDDNRYGDEDVDNYVLYYFRVTADKDVELDYRMTDNGTLIEIDDDYVTEAEVDPDFDLIGELDTELVKYIARLNKDLVAAINACQNYTEIEAIVAELQILLDMDAEVAPTLKRFTLLNECLTPYADEDGTMTTLFKYIKQASAKTQQKEEDSSGNEVLFMGESYLYYDSVYGMYCSWLTKYGYMPEDAGDEASEE